MLRIRLARTGRKKQAHYRVVVSDSRRTPTGGAATQLGYFNPHTKELNLDVEKTQQYIDGGAQPSGRIVRLLQGRDDITLPEWAMENLVTKEEVPAEPETEAAGAESSEPATDEQPAAEEQDEATPEDESDEKEAATPETATADEETTS